jgi:hypothetical protein
MPMEDLTKEQLLQEIKVLKSQKGIGEEADKQAEQQISLYQQAIDWIKEVKS